MEQFVIPYLFYPDAEAAATYYTSVLGGYVRYTMRGKDMPNCPKGQEERVMHMEYAVHHNLIYLADNETAEDMRMQLHLSYLDKAEMERAFYKMAEDGTVVQPLKTEFWGAVFGVVKDPFGITWQFHYRPKRT
jgi:PhnB protein